ncbi:hypothetical protein ACFPAF_16445 [Hymenobacter endophyticus]|uniref:DUF418 domain-containing protein n=1 Tax=Hymenobacter endophyticus TaxID=3076335 RepID=A0ABU3TKU1_9BACT|nr:hypothetical protein [Hymenobacter endophyticus]MDU0371993.1 hypothetical protein [Hymenobacter endophyticus]
MFPMLSLIALTLVAFAQVALIRSVTLRPVPVTSTRFTLLRGGWAILLGFGGWLLLGPGFTEWALNRPELLVLLGVALLAYVDQISRHLLFAFSQQWNQRLVCGMYLATLAGGLLYLLDAPAPVSGWLIASRVLVVLLVLGTFYDRTKRRADRTRWEVTGPAACSR